MMIGGGGDITNSIKFIKQKRYKKLKNPVLSRFQENSIYYIIALENGRLFVYLPNRYSF